MDLSYSLGFIFLIVVMSGGIAYLADKVGKKLGKKRLSIWGLRPRHTAELVTILVGIMISVFTISLILAISSPVRRWLLEGSRVRHQIDDLNIAKNQAAKENQKLETKNGTLQANYSKLVSANLDIKKQLNAGKAEVAKEQQKLGSAQAKLAQLQTRFSTLQSHLTTLQSRISVQDAKIAEGTKVLNDVKQKRQKAETDLASIKINNNEVIQRNIELTQRDAELSAEISDREKQVKQIRADAESLEQQMKEAKSRLGISQTKLDKARSDLETVQATLRERSEELRNLAEGEKNLFDINSVARKMALIFRVGEEVTRLPVHAGLSINNAMEAVTTLLRRARVVAAQRGAKAHRGFAEAGIFAHVDPVSQEQVTTEMIERELVKKIAGSQQDLVLIAVSSLNAFRGESVSLEVSVLNNPLIYTSGQLVAEQVINANKGDAVIWQELQTFFQDKLKTKALKDGMIPIANSDISFGQLSGPDLIQVFEQLNRTDRAIRLQAHAAADTRAADLLKLEFTQR